MQPNMQPEVVEFSQLQNDGEYTDNYLQPENITVIDYYDDRKNDRNTVLTSDINQSDFTLGNTVTITYTATDSNGNQSFASRDITVVDTISPNITLLGQPSLIVPITDLLYNNNDFNAIDPGVTLSDDVSQPENITLTTEIFTTKTTQPENLINQINDVGTYTILYKATDQGHPVYNEKIISRCIEVVYDFPKFPDLGSSPTITLLGQPEITTGISDALINQPSLEPGFTVSDEDTQPENITIEPKQYYKVSQSKQPEILLNSISEFNNVGNYIIVYGARDNFNNKTTKQRCINIVYDYPRFPDDGTQPEWSPSLQPENNNTQSRSFKDIDININTEKSDSDEKSQEKSQEKTESSPSKTKKSPSKSSLSPNQKKLSLKKHKRVSEGVELSEYVHEPVVIVDNSLSRDTDTFERFQYGNYKSFMIKNTTKNTIYMNNLEFFMFTNDKNLRCSLYYIEKNPTLLKNNLEKDTWKEVRLHVRFQSFGRKIIRDGGDVVSIPITEIEIRPRKTIFVIMELDSAGYIDLLSNGSGKHYEYKNTWTTKYQGLYHKNFWLYTW